ncbi:Cytochrome c-type biogenesis protein CcmE [Dissostichus eleginoides]|uniref:Cytochrome c-type biogenesis protein CcmE n=1 Tax=Dissostichus eleginoides TaxID=100907 RepID=A0AAD9BK55_DISEL|nr:Cytochrome c-type biogenesis protein CcmE [Dissostichus eleginoides]
MGHERTFIKQTGCLRFQQEPRRKTDYKTLLALLFGEATRGGLTDLRNILLLRTPREHDFLKRPLLEFGPLEYGSRFFIACRFVPGKCMHSYLKL